MIKHKQKHFFCVFINTQLNDENLYLQLVQYCGLASIIQSHYNNFVLWKSIIEMLIMYNEINQTGSCFKYQRFKMNFLILVSNKLHLNCWNSRPFSQHFWQIHECSLAFRFIHLTVIEKVHNWSKQSKIEIIQVMLITKIWWTENKFQNSELKYRFDSGEDEKLDTMF